MLIAKQSSSITEHDVEVISKKDDSVSEIVAMSTTEPLTTKYKISRNSDSTGNIPHEKSDSKQSDDEKDVVTDDISTPQQKEDNITMSTTRTTSILGDEDDDDNKNKCEDRDNNICDQHNVAQNEQPPSPPITLASSTLSDIQPLSSKQPTGLTEASLARQNKLMEHEEKQNEVTSPSVSSKSAIPLSNSNNAIRAWAATLPEIPDSVHQTPVGPSHIFELNTQDSKNVNNHHHSDSDFDQTKSSSLDDEEENVNEDKKNEPQIQETKDVFTDTQKIAYVGLCAVTSLEVVHDFQGKEFTYARMSADNWHRKLMRTMYMHMDISPEEQKMIESLARHDIRPTDLVHQFTAQGETTTVNMGGYQEVQQPEKKVTKDDEIQKEGETQKESDDQQRRQSIDTTASSSLSNNEINKERVQEQSNKESEESVIESRKSVSSKSDDNNKLDTTILEKSSIDIDNTSTSSLQQQSTTSIGDRSIDVTLDREEEDEDNNNDIKLLDSSSSLSPLSELTISPKQSSTFTTALSDTQISNGPAIDSSSYSTSNDDSIANNDISNCEQNRQHSNINDEEQRQKEGDTAQNGVNGQFVIDLRWTVMCDLFLLCLSAENYDARSRVFIARMASYLELDWFQVIGFEKRITEHLMQDAGAAWETETTTSIATTQTTTTDIEVSIRNDVERKSRNKQRRKRRYIMIGLATIGGGLILGLSAGLMAPVIAGGIGTILTTVGVTGTSTFLGGTASIALITGGATAIGGTKRMRKRMKMINTFEFSPVTVDENVSCIVSISGWLPKGATKDTAALPFSTLDSIMGDHYTLYWEPEMLEALGSGLKIFATEAVTFSIQQALAHTIMGALLAGLAWPLALTKLGYLVDNPWNNGLDRARLAGLILADSLMNRNLGARPVTLIGYSLGARVIFYCLLELSRVNAYGLVENVALFGTPVSASKQQWKECTTVVAGRFINGYASNDWLLGFLFRASTAGLGNVAGLRPLKHIDGNRVQNVDCTDLVKGHLSYRVLMPKLLKRAGFVVNSEELPSAIERENEEDEFVIDLSGAKDLEQFRPATMVRGSSVSSLTSGKASIQYPPPKTKCHPPRTTEEAQQQQQQRQEEQSSRSPSPPPPPTRQDSSSTPNQQLSLKKQSPVNSPKISSPLSTEDVSPKSSISIKTFTNNDDDDHDDDDDDQNTSIPQQQQQHGEKQRQNGLDSSVNDASIIKENTTVVNGMSDQDIIADIIAKAAAVSKSSGNYSSLSSGRASIAQHRPDSPTSTTMITSSSETTTTTSIRVSISADDGKESPSRRSVSSSSLFGKSLLFNKNRKKSQEEKGQQELSEQGIEVKELKSTLGRMVVPTEVANPMPKFTLEKPQYARVNR
ncbi:hypothetical protein INT45_005233 [Circinella minor]|uniref:DUF726-domain-containing protein n=1 Tax=Circinella minor TaxID=1195481 RepID=A0A8H7S4Q6_9FUNG|nr:hypothetical protein INT45_005233 [Circinella minor]